MSGAGCGPSCGRAAEPGDDGCSGAEPFVLRVLGDDMRPEFTEGEIIVVEPDGDLRDGRYVVAQVEGQWWFRQLRRGGDGWSLHALRDGLPSIALPDLSGVRGVVIQAAVPGRRHLTRHYV